MIAFSCQKIKVRTTKQRERPQKRYLNQTNCYGLLQKVKLSSDEDLFGESEVRLILREEEDIRNAYIAYQVQQQLGVKGESEIKH